MNKSKLIIFEGMECCGKSKQIDLLTKYFQDQNIELAFGKEPGQTETGNKIKDILKFGEEPLSPRTQLLLLNASRSDIYEKIIMPELAKGKVIIQDRAWPSSVAYQSFAGGIDIDEVEKIIRFSIGERMPDIVFYMRIPMEKYEQTLKERVAIRNEKIDNFEKQNMDYFSKVFQGYEYLAEKYKDT